MRGKLCARSASSSGSGGRSFLVTFTRIRRLSIVRGVRSKGSAAPGQVEPRCTRNWSRNPNEGGEIVSAKHKLNSAYLLGSLVIASIFGVLTQSFVAFVIAL